MVTFVRTGDEYQAQIPPLLAPDEQTQQRQLMHAAVPPYIQRWGQPPANVPEGAVEQFLMGLSHFSEIDQALQILFASGFDLAAAGDLLRAARRQKIRELDRDSQELSDDAFGNALAAHGKKFHLVKQALPGVESTRDVVRRFYLWKTSAGYARWREGDKARKRKESTRVLRRRWGEDSDSDAPSDYHNEYCDLCFTGGQLLCCDGCCRAFHFSCVTPPIKEVPKDDWFCAQCRTLLSSDIPVVQSSVENAFCGVVLVDGKPLTSTICDSRGENASRRRLSASVDIRAGSDAGGHGSGVERADLDTRGQQKFASLTDNDESDPGEQLGEGATTHAATTLQREKAAVAKRWASSSVESSPSSSLASTSLLSASASRKRQRKVDAPRRILMPETPPATAQQSTERVKASPGPLPAMKVRTNKA